LGTGEVGLGQSAEQARAVTVEATPEGKRLLREYLDTVYAMATRWIATLNETELDRVIDDQWDPPVTLGIRVISVLDRKSTRLNSSHVSISYAVFCLNK